MQDLLVDNDVVHNLTTPNKVALVRCRYYRHDFFELVCQNRHDFLELVCQNFGDHLIGNVAQTDRSELQQKL